MAHLVLYDGVCGLCDRSAQLVLARDRFDRFRLAPLQGTIAAELLPRYGRSPADLDTVYVVANHGQPDEALLWRSKAILFVMRGFGGLWAVAARLLGWIPAALADRAYDFIAARRYRWFGRLDTCRVPDARQRAKFLEDPAPPR